MAIAFEDNLKKNIASGQFLPVYILFGDDGYLKKNYADKISKKIADPDDIFAFSKFTADCDLQDVYDAVMQLPITTDKKCVLLEDYDFEHCAKSDLDKLCDLLADTPDTAVLILRFESVDIDVKKSTKFKRLVSSAEKSGGMAVQLNHRTSAELVKMLCDGASKRGCRMDTGVARYLIETAGEDINLLRNELSKLCFFVGEGNITKETVDKVCIKTVEASIFNLSKHILACDVQGALSTLDELLFMRIEPMAILYTVSGIYIDMFRVYSAKSAGKTVKDVSEAFAYKNKAFLLDKAANNLRKFDFKKLNLSLEALMEADNRLKSFGADERIILEQLLIRLIFIIVKGESVDKT